MREIAQVCASSRMFLCICVCACNVITTYKEIIPIKYNNIHCEANELSSS